MKIQLTPQVLGGIQACLEWTLEEPGFEGDRENAAAILEIIAPLVRHLPTGMVSIPPGKSLVEVVLSSKAAELIYRANELAGEAAGELEGESLEVAEGIKKTFGDILRLHRSLS